MSKSRHYEVSVIWTGNDGSGTSGYAAYRRDYDLHAIGKPFIAGSSDIHYRGDNARWNPEELLVASLSACHKLWYLHLCADAGVIVSAYEDRAEGVMIEEGAGEGKFTSVVLRPRVTIRSDSDLHLAKQLHKIANSKCFIARSVSFPVTHEPVIIRSREAVPS